VSALLAIALNFAVLSLIAVGGVTPILPELHRVAVEAQGWMTDSQFKDLFAIAQAAPGPNMMIVTLIGWHAAGLAGAIVATAAMVTPCCTLTFVVSRAWQRLSGTPWRRAVEAGLAPLTVGLVLAGGYRLATGGEPGWPAYGLTAATAALVVFTRVNPLWLFAAAATLGLAGVV